MTTRATFSGRRLYRMLAAVTALLLALVLWQLGSGSWMNAKAQVGKVLEVEEAWEAQLAQGPQHRPWTWTDVHPVARLEAPDLGVSLIVLSGSDAQTLAKGPGHIEGTVPPGGNGHSIISGQRDGHFRFLESLAPGSKLRVQRPDGQWRSYRVTSAEVMDSRQAQLASGSGWPVLSLVARWPNRGAGGAENPWRYVVTAEVVAEQAELTP